MNFIRIFQLSRLIILLEICVTSMKADPARCYIQPNGVDKVDVLVYINGGTRVDNLWYERYCKWLSSGFPYDKYAPITVNVGAAVTCDDDNKCNCPNQDSSIMDCTTTFQYVCIEQILGQDEFKKFLCCLVTFVNGISGPIKDYQMCVNERPGLAENISKCMENDGPGGPRDIALKHSGEVANAGVDMANNTEPFFIYNEIFDKCISDDSPGWWLQKLCLMIKYKKAKKIKQCKVAMGW